MTEEERLIARILNGHVEDYGYFLERYGDEVMRLVGRLVRRQEDAEELVQDAFIRALDRLDTFDRRSSFGTWICRIAYNLTISFLRKRQLQYISIDDDPSLTEADVSQTMNDDTLVEALRSAIEQLRPEEQALINLYYYDNRPTAEIAYILKLEPGAVAARLFRIRRKLHILVKHGNKA